MYKDNVYQIAEHERYENVRVCEFCFDEIPPINYDEHWPICELCTEELRKHVMRIEQLKAKDNETTTSEQQRFWENSQQSAREESPPTQQADAWRDAALDRAYWLGEDLE